MLFNDGQIGRIGLAVQVDRQQQDSQDLLIKMGIAAYSSTGTRVLERFGPDLQIRRATSSSVQSKVRPGSTCKTICV